MHVLLIDGHNLLYRSFCSLPDSITDEAGRPIHAVYGLLTYLVRTVRELDLHHIVVALDDPVTPTFRHLRFPGYQAQRGPLGGERADDFSRQVDLAGAALPRLGIPTPKIGGYEADDVMGTLAVRLAAEGNSATIVSTDRDLLQLVRPGIAVMAPGNPPRIAATDTDVVERLGVRPEGVVPWKALSGDPSDNIPGVPGIGSKTAATLVDRYGDLDAIYAHLADLPAGTARKLTAGREAAYLFRDIVTITTDVETGLDTTNLPTLQIGPTDRARDLLRQAGVA